MSRSAARLAVTQRRVNPVVQVGKCIQLYAHPAAVKQEYRSSREKIVLFIAANALQR